MTNQARGRRHLASSPFRPDPEPIVEEFEVDDLVSHDSYGMGRVTHVDTAAVTVNFGAQTVRVARPFHKMSKL
ncbi:hypothetical protein [Nocardioides sp. T2.26MG-1]|uniref:hypothetical protein n=1 Tax=Nocardioides sp. T2.26MG-1 TaxID=3041166 RepID=UPI0024776B95|nr:hypothetical protein [Nocardioides sp. T2.26MG-1]CAI9413770.1 hypothetical protein HIDPHFAB_02105 [Nocardioides sp. T2.26MG-1]